MNILRINDGEYEIPYRSFQEEYVKGDESIDISLTIWLYDIKDIPEIETFYFTKIQKIQLIQNDQEVYVTTKYPEISHILFSSSSDEEDGEQISFSANILFAIRVYKDGSSRSITSSYYKTPEAASDFEENENVQSCSTLCSVNCIGVCTALCTANEAEGIEE